MYMYSLYKLYTFTSSGLENHIHMHVDEQTINNMTSLIICIYVYTLYTASGVSYTFLMSVMA